MPMDSLKSVKQTAAFRLEKIFDEAFETNSYRTEAIFGVNATIYFRLRVKNLANYDKDTLTKKSKDENIFNRSRKRSSDQENQCYFKRCDCTLQKKETTQPVCLH